MKPPYYQITTFNPDAMKKVLSAFVDWRVEGIMKISFLAGVIETKSAEVVEVAKGVLSNQAYSIETITKEAK